MPFPELEETVLVASETTDRIIGCCPETVNGQLSKSGNGTLNAHQPDDARLTLAPNPWHLRIKRDLRALVVLLIVYLGFAYMIVPAWWRRHTSHPALLEAPKTTRTPDGIPGDPLNIALVGSRQELVEALLAAGWYPADPITLRTSLRISKSVLLNRPYPEAPVSNLMLWGRPQDLAFQLAFGNSPKKRHHVRFWQSEERDTEGRPLWLGAATFDRSVGLSHRTGQVTHHIDAGVDQERDKLVLDLQAAGQLTEVYQVAGVGPTTNGRNGGGDRYCTDGQRAVGVLRSRSDDALTAER
jgi:hypothetical protein